MDKIEKLKELAKEEKARKKSVAFRMNEKSKQGLELLAEISGKSQAGILEELINEEVSYQLAHRKNKIKELENLREVDQKYNDLKAAETDRD